MNRLENSGRRDSGPGRSRAKGAAKGSGGSRARGSSSYRSGQAGRMNAVQTSRRNSSYRRKKDPNYKLTGDYDKRNLFDIEKFLDRRLKLKPSDVYDVVDADFTEVKK